MAGSTKSKVGVGEPAANTRSTVRPGSQYETAPDAVAASRKLSSFDAQFLAAETGNILSNFCGIFVFDPPQDGDEISREGVIGLIESRIGSIPPLRWRLQTVPFNLDHPSFITAPVNVADHVIAHTLPEPGGPTELCDVGAAILAERMDRSRPLWEIHVIDGVADGGVGIAFKFHHAVADALGASTIAGLLLDPSPTGGRPLPPAVPDGVAEKRSRLFFRGLRATLSHPARAARAAATALPQIDQVPMMRTLPGVQRVAATVRRAAKFAGRPSPEAAPFSPAPRTRLNGPLSRGRSAGLGTVEVAMVRKLKSAYGVSFNDIVMAAVAGGMRTVFAEKDELPDQPLVAFVPANVRTVGEDGGFGNAISSYVVPIPSNLAEPGERVAAAAAAMLAAKKRHALTPPTLMIDANDLIPPLAFRALAGGLLQMMGTGRFEPPVNLLVSNVPGPQVPVYMLGGKLRSILPLSLIFPGALLNVTVISYIDRLDIGLTGDAEAVPDVAELAAAIVAEFDALTAAAPQP